MDPICGKVDNLLLHLRECTRVTADIKAWALNVPTTAEKRAQENITQSIPYVMLAREHLRHWN